MKNDKRAKRGYTAIRAYIQGKGERVGKVAVEDVVDLVTDILHYSRVKGFDTDAVMRMARASFEGELREEGQQ